MMWLFFTIVCLVQLIYGLIFFFGFLSSSWKKNPKPVPLTILICAHNAEKLLRANIHYVLECLQADQELIVVDDHSADMSLRFLQSIQHPQLRVLQNQDTKGKKYAQRLGVSEATHEFILVTDADCRPLSSDWSSAVASQIDKPLTLLYSPYIHGGGLLGLMVQSETYMTAVQYMSYAQFLQPYMGVGRNLCFRKKDYLDNIPEGFYEIPYGDDDLLVSNYATRLNTAVNYQSETWTTSPAPSTWKKWLAQKSRHSSTGKRYKWNQKIELALFPMTLLAFYYLVFTQFEWMWVFLILIARRLFFMFFYSSSLQRLGYGKYIWATGLIEFLWLVYLVLLSPFIFIFNKKAW